MIQTDAKDDNGRLIDAAGRVYLFAKQELTEIKRLSKSGEEMPNLLHAIFMVWASEHIDEGLLTEDEPEYDKLCNLLVSLYVKCIVREKGRR
jgi:hypothetical protein